MQNHYTVNKVAKSAGITVRALHHYDKIGLLKPSIRTESGYRLYSNQELLTLQQILFYKELGFQLSEIQEVINSPKFEIIESLISHKQELKRRARRINALISTIDNTINNIEKGDIMKPQDLYEGLSPEYAKEYRNEAIEKWGDKVKKSEQYLSGLGKEKFNKLKDEFSSLWKEFSGMTHLEPSSAEVQEKIARHYAMIRQFWGTANLEDKQADAYIGLGAMYECDSRFTTIDGQNNPQMGPFLKKAMKIFADNNLS